MATHKFRPSNGVSFGLVYTVLTADATATTITFDFGAYYGMVASIQVVDSSNNLVALTGAVVTYPSVGKVTIANGSGFTLTAGYKISLVAQRATAEIV